MDHGRVDLPDLHQRPEAAILIQSIHGLQKQRAIAFDVGVSVMLGLPKVERPAAVTSRDSALARAEAVD